MTAKGDAPAQAQLRHLGCLASLFSPTLIRRLPTPSALSEIKEILSVTGLSETCRALPLGFGFENAYTVLLDMYRCEYLYKNVIASELLLKKHCLRTAGLLTELQVEDCKLDLLMVNGEAVAYEIKTELDSPDRLFNQLTTYQRAFERVYVVTHESCASRFTHDLPPGVGAMVLGSNYALDTLQEATSDYSRLDPGVIFNVLRRAEYEGIIRKYFDAVPAVPNTRIYSECRRLFLELSIKDICSEMTAVFHERSSRALVVSRSEVETAPHSLLLHVLNGNVAHEQYAALSDVVL